MFETQLIPRHFSKSSVFVRLRIFFGQCSHLCKVLKGQGTPEIQLRLGRLWFWGYMLENFQGDS